MAAARIKGRVLTMGDTNTHVTAGCGSGLPGLPVLVEVQAPARTLKTPLQPVRELEETGHEDILYGVSRDGASLVRSGWINCSIGSDGVWRTCDFNQTIRSNKSCRKLMRPEQQHNDS